jgi:hypothetical protein
LLAGDSFEFLNQSLQCGQAGKTRGRGEFQVVHGSDEPGVAGYRFMFQGNLIAVSSKCKGKDGKELAKRMEADHRLKLGEGRGGLKPIAKQVTFGVAAKAFLLEKKPHWAKKRSIIWERSLVRFS